jgi:hypothetical protein
VQPVSSSELRFRYGQASASELQALVDDILTELRDQTSETALQAREAGLDPSVLGDADISIHGEQGGLDPVLTTILVGITIQGGSNLAREFWDAVILPRLRRRLGTTALGAEVET